MIRSGTFGRKPISEARPMTQTNTYNTSATPSIMRNQMQEEIDSVPAFLRKKI
jgi:hypothetical protein